MGTWRAAQLTGASLALAASLAACASSSRPISSPPKVSTPPATSVATPVATAMTAAAAAQQIRTTVTGAHPLLLPTAIPSDWTAQAQADASSFDVIYRSPSGTKSVEFSITVPNPPPPGVNGRQSSPAFHGDRLSLYQVDDATQTTSDRWLIWNEPGTWSQPNGLPGVPYFLAATGLTDAEFWSVANSMHR